MDLISSKHLHLTVYKHMFFIHLFRWAFSIDVVDTEWHQKFYTNGDPYRHGCRKEIRKRDNADPLNGTNWICSFPLFGKTIQINLFHHDGSLY